LKAGFLFGVVGKVLGAIMARLTAINPEAHEAPFGLHEEGSKT